MYIFLSVFCFRFHTLEVCVKLSNCNLVAGSACVGASRCHFLGAARAAPQTVVIAIRDEEVAPTDTRRLKRSHSLKNVHEASCAASARVNP